MSVYYHNQKPYDSDDDERFYEETVYNEEYYIEQEQELIRQSNLDLGVPSAEWRRHRFYWGQRHSAEGTRLSEQLARFREFAY